MVLSTIPQRQQSVTVAARRRRTRTAADSYVADSDEALAAFKHAYTTLGQADDVVYGTKAKVAVDAPREGIKMNGIQNSTATGNTLTGGDEPTPPAIDLPL